jgi:hypothetical protein
MKIKDRFPKKPRIPVQLTQKEFDEFICDAIPKPNRGPEGKVPRSKIFNYILKQLIASLFLRPICQKPFV